MRVQFSEEVNKLADEVLPYVHVIKGLDPNAPEDIKEKYIKVRKLIREQYAAAGGIVI